MHAIHAVFRSIAFLSRLPVPAGAFTGERRLGEDAWAFPLAGLLIALPAAGVLAVAALAGLSIPTGAVGAVIVLVLVTGALHEDGLADVADGLGGHHPKERALAIMKDSRIGAYGALALILSLFARISLLADLGAIDRNMAALALMLAAGASRGAMALLWSSLPPAAPGGVADRAGAPSPRTGRVAAGLGAAILVSSSLAFMGPAAAILPVLLAGAVLIPYRRMLRRRLGGITGDGLGAGQQIAEIAILLGFALALR